MTIALGTPPGAAVLCDEAGWRPPRAAQEPMR
jgi:hypothetical protein